MTAGGVAVLQELDGLHQQLRGLQEQLQESSQEVVRLEADALALDNKAVQLQAELEEAQRAHQDALHHLQVYLLLLILLDPQLVYKTWLLDMVLHNCPLTSDTAPTKLCTLSDHLCKAPRLTSSLKAQLHSILINSAE